MTQNSNMRDDDAPDLELRAMLRDHTGQPPFDDVDWSALHTRITTRARPLLHRSPAPWWQLIAGWSGYGIPATALAAALLVVVLGTAVMRPVAAPAGDSVAYITLDEELNATAGTVLDASAEDLLEDMLLDGAAW